MKPGLVHRVLVTLLLVSAASPGLLYECEQPEPGRLSWNGRSFSTWLPTKPEPQLSQNINETVDRSHSVGKGGAGHTVLGGQVTQCWGGGREGGVQAAQ